MELDLLNEISDRQNLLNFINREEPQKILDNVISCWGDNCTESKHGYLINFHGVAGKGKTELHKKLKKNLDNEHSDVKYIHWDARRESTPSYSIPDILLLFRNELVVNYDYDFNEFDYYISLFNTALHKEFKLLSYQKDSNYRGLGFEALKSSINVFLDYTGVLTIIEESADFFTKAKGHSSNKINKDNFKRFSGLQEHEKIELLLKSFISEFNKQAGIKPICIFIDTFEDIYTENLRGLLSSEKNAINSCRGLFHELINVVWIISGRDSINPREWSIQNSEVFVLNNFTEKDHHFFIESNIGNFSLEEVERIWEFTEGNPLLLKVLHDIYSDTEDKNEIFNEIEKARKTTGRVHEVLLDRYSRYLKYDQNSQDNQIFAELFKVFVCLGSWSADISEQESFKIFTRDRLRIIDIEEYVREIYSKSIIENKNSNYLNILGIDPTVQKVLLNSMEHGKPVISNNLKKEVLDYLISTYIENNSKGINNFNQISILIRSIYRNESGLSLHHKFLEYTDGIVNIYKKKERFYSAYELMILAIDESKGTNYHSEYIQNYLETIIEGLLEYQVYDLIPLLESKLNYNVLNFENKVHMLMLYERAGQYSNVIKNFEALMSQITDSKQLASINPEHIYAELEGGYVRIIHHDKLDLIVDELEEIPALFHFNIEQTRILANAFESYVLSNIYLNNNGNIEKTMAMIRVISDILNDTNIKLKYSLLVLEYYMVNDTYWDDRKNNYFNKQMEILISQGRQFFAVRPDKLMVLYNAALTVFKIRKFDLYTNSMSLITKVTEEDIPEEAIPIEKEYIAIENAYLTQNLEELKLLYEERLTNDFQNHYAGINYIYQAYSDLKIAFYLDDLNHAKILSKRYTCEFSQKFGENSIQTSKLYMQLGDGYYSEAVFGLAMIFYGESLNRLKGILRDNYVANPLVIEPQTRYLESQVRYILGSNETKYIKREQFKEIYEEIKSSYNTVLEYNAKGLPFYGRLIYTYDFVLDIIDSFLCKNEFEQLLHLFEYEINQIKYEHPIVVRRELMRIADGLAHVLWYEQRLFIYTESGKFFDRLNSEGISRVKLECHNFATKRMHEHRNGRPLLAFAEVTEDFYEILLNQGLKQALNLYVKYFENLNSNTVVDKNDAVFTDYIHLRQDYLKESNKFYYDILRALNYLTHTI